MQVTVLGAGVAGLVCATQLAERGVAVRVLERGVAPGAQSCAWMAGGMLAPDCEGESAPPAVTRLGRAAAPWWTARVPGVQQHGTLVLAPPRDTVELQRFAARTGNHRNCDADTIAQLEPDLAGRFRHGLWFADEAHLDPRRVLPALVDRLRQRDVPIDFGHTARPADHDTCIDCRGYAARDALPDLRGVRGEMLLLRTHDVRLTRPVRLLHPRWPLYLVPRGDGLYMIGASMLENDQPHRVSARAVAELIQAAYTLHPAFAEADVIEIGSQVRPAFPDHLPRVMRMDGHLHVNGLYRHGFLLAPAMARIAAGALLDTTYRSEFLS